MVHKALHHEHTNRTPGGLLMDTDANSTWQELLSLASDRSSWRRRVKALRDGKSATKKPSESTRTTNHHCNTRINSKSTPPSSTNSEQTQQQTRAAQNSKPKSSAKLYPMRGTRTKCSSDLVIVTGKANTKGTNNASKRSGNNRP